MIARRLRAYAGKVDGGDRRFAWLHALMLGSARFLLREHNFDYSLRASVWVAILIQISLCPITRSSNDTQVSQSVHFARHNLGTPVKLPTACKLIHLFPFRVLLPKHRLIQLFLAHWRKRRVTRSPWPVRSLIGYVLAVVSGPGALVLLMESDVMIGISWVYVRSVTD